MIEPTYEIFLSTDGKHTVHINAENEVELVNAYKVASKMYKKIIEDFGAGTKQADAIERKEKEENLGTCPDCGGPMAISKRTGKEYCRNLCWKK